MQRQMPNIHPEPLHSAEVTARQIAQRYPDAEAIFLAGSIVRGDGTPTSDLDIVIVTTMDPAAPYRQSLMLKGWPIELFVHTPDSLQLFFEKDMATRTPSLLNMCIEGHLLTPANAQSKQIQTEAHTLMEKGPPALSVAEIAARRYALTDLLNDLEGCSDPIEYPFICQQLLSYALETSLAHQQAWSGKGKWLWRALKRANPEQANRLEAILCLQGKAYGTALKHWVENEVLAPLGGPLFDGYYQGASQ